MATFDKNRFLVRMVDHEGKTILLNPYTISYIRVYDNAIDERYNGLTKVSIMGMNAYFFKETPEQVAGELGFIVKNPYE